jgi:hypothetical protein
LPDQAHCIFHGQYMRDGLVNALLVDLSCSHDLLNMSIKFAKVL